LNVKEAPGIFQLVLNILCVTYFVTSTITLFPALLLEKLSVWSNRNKAPEKEKRWHIKQILLEFSSKR